jgi:hypothetical protein
VVEPYVPHNSSRGEPPPPELAGGLGWVVAMPRAKVKGTLTVDGQKIPVEGEGYHDHNWASGAAGGPGGGVGASGWLWGRNHFGRHTLVWSAGNVGGLVIVGRDDKIIAISDRATSSTADFSSEGYPVKYPRAIELNFNEPGVITGGMKLRMLKVLDFMDLLSRLKPFQRWYTHSYVRQPAYFRYMLDGEADLEIKGEPVRYKGNIWFEHMKLK